MPNQLIPPPDLAPPSVKHLPPEKKIELWFELLDESEAMLLAGLRAKIGPHGDLQAAYREWYARYMEEHDRKLIAFAENLSRREAAICPASTRAGPSAAQTAGPDRAAAFAAVPKRWRSELE